MKTLKIIYLVLLPMVAGSVWTLEFTNQIAPWWGWIIVPFAFIYGWIITDIWES